MKVKCPRCGLESEFSADNPYRPFCSRRCKESDLYDWLTEEDGSRAEAEPPKAGDSGDFPGSGRGQRH